VGHTPTQCCVTSLVGFMCTTCWPQHSHDRSSRRAALASKPMGVPCAKALVSLVRTFLFGQTKSVPSKQTLGDLSGGTDMLCRCTAGAMSRCTTLCVCFLGWCTAGLQRYTRHDLLGPPTAH
jgi:hypothetical protein